MLHLDSYHLLRLHYERCIYLCYLMATLELRQILYKKSQTFLMRDFLTLVLTT